VKSRGQGRKDFLKGQRGASFTKGMHQVLPSNGRNSGPAGGKEGAEIRGFPRLVPEAGI